MTIKVVENKKSKEVQYPCLMVHEADPSWIVYMWEEQQGVDIKLGNCRTNWCKDSFTPYEPYII